MANPLLEEIERWQGIYDWFVSRPTASEFGEGFNAEAIKVEGFLRHMIASTNISTPPSTLQPNERT